jgi:hypothetical protein
MAAMNRKYMHNTFILACVFDGNEIPTVPMFSGQGNTERLVKIVSDFWVCWNFRMAAIERKLADLSSSLAEPKIIDGSNFQV